MIPGSTSKSRTSWCSDQTSCAQ